VNVPFSFFYLDSDPAAAANLVLELAFLDANIPKSLALDLSNSICYGFVKHGHSYVLYIVWKVASVELAFLDANLADAMML
jgi:hypothetical protein